MGRFFSLAELLQVTPRILAAAPVTIMITLAAFALGVILGMLLALARLYRVPVVSQFAALYISFVRGTPILIQLLIVNLALPSLIWRITGYNVGRYWPPITFVVFAYALNCAAFLSEIIRSAVSGVDAGQSEAACAVGMTGLQAFAHVVFPQALRIALPSAANTMSGLLKDTSLAYSAAGVLDMMGIVGTNAARTFRHLEGYIGVAIVFFVMCVLLEWAFSALARRLNRGMPVLKGA